MPAPQQQVGKHGARLGEWVLERVIGTPGEQGEVWQAHAVGYTAIKFAIKIGRIPIRTDADPAYREFVEEFDALASLRHPNIVRVYHRGTYQRRSLRFPYYVMEYLLDDVSPFQVALEKTAYGKRVALCLQALLDTSSALCHVHDNGRFHGDIKESNILVATNADGVPSIKLIDFGFSRMQKTVDKTGGARAGRGPKKPSSKPRSYDAATAAHADIYQLALVIQRALDTEAKDEPRHDAANNWPIDQADYSRTYDLLSSWSSTAANSAPERLDEIGRFREQISAIRARWSITNLVPDVKGAVRHFSLPELATAAHISRAFEAIRLPPRQLILYTRRIKELITTPEFGALRYTRQLGFTHLVYPGAQGTRFEHCLGVYGLACRFLVRMVGHTVFRKTCPDTQDLLKFLVAALLHDVGHFPFAHQLEEISRHDFSEVAWHKVQNLIGPDHDSHRVKGEILIRRRLGPKLKTFFSMAQRDINEIADLALSKEEQMETRSDALRLLHSLIDGPIDLDKLDYVERDAHHCGVPYGNYLDIDRLLETMRIVEDKASSLPVLAFDWRAVGSLEQLATARHEMYANVYWHRAVRSATTMFKHAFFLLQQRVATRERLESFFFGSGSDDGVLATILKAKEVRRPKLGDQDGKALVRLLTAVSGRDRNLYKEVWQSRRDKEKIERCGLTRFQQRQAAKNIFHYLEKKGFLAKGAEILGEHNVLLDCHRDDPANFELINIRNHLGQLKTLGEMAPSVTRLRENFEIQACHLRVFINVDALRPDYQSKNGRVYVGKAVGSLLGAS